MANEAKPATKSEMLKHLCDHSGLNKKDVTAILDGLNELIKRELSKKGPGVFTMPGLIKLKLVHKPATKAGKKPNPFKPGEMMEVKAKPARRVVKALPLKSLKDMVAS